ncbi:MAG: SWIM zinc finger family protein [Bacteroidota bacterium]
MFTEQQIEKLAPKESTFKAGKKLALAAKWETLEKSDRAIWGSVRGSGKKPYLTQIDTANIAYKCTCPSRQFPCKHAVGLMLVNSIDPAAFTVTKEPDYVQEWLDKRAKRAEKVDKEEKEITEEEKEKRSSAKAKREDDKLKLTLAGVSELKLWLKDLVRIGLLELPNRPSAYFDTMIERMVDCKAPGLGGWVRALKNLPYREQQIWQDRALDILAKLFLLIKAAEHLDQYPDAEQKAIKSLLGWTFIQKELATDPNSISLKDRWLVLGSHSEIQEDLTITRYWLYGLDLGKDALIIRFYNKFSNAEHHPIVEGTAIEAELTFYPGFDPHRAFIKKQKEVIQSLRIESKLMDNWQSYQDHLMQNIQRNPWTNNRAGLISNVKIVNLSQGLAAVDKDRKYFLLSPELEEDKVSTLLLNSVGERINMAFVNRNEGILPLGLFIENKYQVL